MPNNVIGFTETQIKPSDATWKVLETSFSYIFHNRKIISILTLITMKINS